MFFAADSSFPCLCQSFSVCPVGVFVCRLFSVVVFDYYKTVTWAASLMNCWLLWQSVAVSIYCILFIARWQINMIWLAGWLA